MFTHDVRVVAAVVGQGRRGLLHDLGASDRPVLDARVARALVPLLAHQHVAFGGVARLALQGGGQGGVLPCRQGNGVGLSAACVAPNGVGRVLHRVKQLLLLLNSDKLITIIIIVHVWHRMAVSGQNAP